MRPEASSVSLEEPGLVIDGSGASVFVGLLGTEGKWLSQVNKKSAPLEGLFPSVEAVLHSAQFQISDVHNFIYCEGPGSVLGLRLCAMAIQTWGHLCELDVRYFAYNSLELMAALIVSDISGVNHALLISDWKKDAWNSILIREGQAGAITTIDNQTVSNWKEGPLFYLPQRKGWQKVPENATTLEYDPQRLPEAMQLLKKTKKIELYTSNMNVFRKWVPQRHRAPS
jgi:tRNA threonylcarbamoyladenosine biosynthesis protein TsaB